MRLLVVVALCMTVVGSRPIAAQADTHNDLPGAIRDRAQNDLTKLNPEMR